MYLGLLVAFEKEFGGSSMGTEGRKAELPVIIMLNNSRTLHLLGLKRNSQFKALPSWGLWPCHGVLDLPSLSITVRVAQVGHHYSFAAELYSFSVGLLWVISETELCWRWDSRFMQREIFSVVLRYVFVAGNMVPLWHSSLGTPYISRSWLNCALNIILW